MKQQEKKRPSLTDYFDYKKVRDYVQGTYNYYYQNDIALHIKEQAFYRGFLCSPCLSAGSCMHCGCNTPALFFAPHKIDAGDKWGEMLEPDVWEEYKKENNIDIKNIETTVMQAIKQNAKIADGMIEDMPELTVFSAIPEYSEELKKELNNGVTKRN